MADCLNDRVQVFDLSGTFVRQWAGSDPCGLGSADGKISGPGQWWKAKCHATDGHLVSLWRWSSVVQSADSTSGLSLTAAAAFCASGIAQIGVSLSQAAKMTVALRNLPVAR